MYYTHPSDIEGKCELCGIGEIGVKLERYASTDAILCTYCVETLVREWKNNKHVVRR